MVSLSKCNIAKKNETCSFFKTVVSTQFDLFCCSFDTCLSYKKRAQMVSIKPHNGNIWGHFPMFGEHYTCLVLNDIRWIKIKSIKWNAINSLDFFLASKFFKLFTGISHDIFILCTLGSISPSTNEYISKIIFWYFQLHKKRKFVSDNQNKICLLKEKLQQCIHYKWRFDFGDHYNFTLYTISLRITVGYQHCFYFLVLPPGTTFPWAHIEHIIDYNKIRTINVDEKWVMDSLKTITFRW